ncbi:hypothetical protein T4C_146 [Trichinella pseudospiralis]|uniref:Uncharacterized protein n=1 Tax=Trichinella pseudospiralis TaxID=6337 RepID=A0A0V1K376_TRIPS|nr:hypothetical protein T4C_146 [Trichinella pseudospiralis]
MLLTTRLFRLCKAAQSKRLRNQPSYQTNSQGFRPREAESSQENILNNFKSKSNYPNADYPNIRLSKIFLGGWSKSIVFLLSYVLD